MTQVPYDVLIPGNYFCDLIFTGFPEFPALGTEVYSQGLTVVPGGVLNTIISLQRLGVRVGWIGAIGQDFFSRYIYETAQKEGVDTSLLKQQATPLQRVTVAVSYPQDRAFITYVDPAPNPVSMTLEAIEQKIPFKHLHFSGLTSDQRTPELIQECRARGIRVSMDCQHRPYTLDTPPIRDIIGSLDIFMPNRSEALHLTHQTSLEAAAEILQGLVPLLIIKDGVNGVHAWHHGDYYQIPALSLPAIVDTTGAGDAFNAGFLAASFAGHDLETGLKWGTICGGLSTQGYGGASNAPTLEILKTYLR